MGHVIPNSDPVDNDCCLTPIVVDVPLLLISRGDDCYWFHETMDKSTAKRTLFTIMQSLDVEAFRVNVKVILPAASDIRAVTAELGELTSKPVRVILKANG